MELVKLYCLKPSKLWRTGDFFLVHPSLSQTVKLFSLQFLSSLFFFNLWHVVPRFPSLNVHLFLPDKSGSVLSSKSYPSIKWFMVREPVFASLYSLYCFHVSKTKKNKSKVEEMIHGMWTGICLSVSLCSFHVSKTKDKKLKVEEKYTPKNYK